MNRKDSGRVRRDEEARSPKKPCSEPPGSGEPTATVQQRLHHTAAPPGVANASFGVIPSSISEANRNLGTLVAKLLEQNYMILNEIKQNMSLLKVQENAQLLGRFRDNLVCMMEHMQSMKGVVGQMPTLPAQLNNELADKSLPKAGQNASGIFAPLIPVPPLGFPMPPAAIPPLPFNGFFPMPLAGLLPGAMPMRVPQMNMMAAPNGLPVAPNLQTVGLVNSLAGIMVGTQPYGCPLSHPIVKGGQEGGETAELLAQQGSMPAPAPAPCSTAMKSTRPVVPKAEPGPARIVQKPQPASGTSSPRETSGEVKETGIGMDIDQENIEVGNEGTLDCETKEDVEPASSLPDKTLAVSPTGGAKPS